jgi:glutamate dehydrogenase (NAD(P)+)
MTWIMDTYSVASGDPGSTVVTGKPVIVGGSSVRRSATGLGVACVTRAACDRLGLERQVRVAVVGYGNVGREVAELLDDDRFSIVAVANLSGGRHCADGIDTKRLARRLDAGTPLVDAVEGDLWDGHTPVEREVLIPAAIAGQVDAAVAETLSAVLVVEGANGPTTPAADRLLAARGVLVVPDVLANGGGVTASHLAWAHGRFGLTVRPVDVARTVEERLADAFETTWRWSEAHGVTLRQAALCLAVRRVADAHLARGLYP